MRPVHALEHDLPLIGPIEHHRHAVLEMARLVEHAARRVPRQHVAELGLAALALHDRAVVDDERERDRQAIDDRAGEVKAPSGDESDLDAERRRFDQRLAVRVGSRPWLSSSVPSMSMARSA